MSGAAPHVREFAEVIPALTAGTSDTYTIFEAPFDGELTGASYFADTDITGAATNSRTLNVINKGQAGNGTTVMATLALTSGENAADFDEKALTLSVVEGAVDFVEGDVIAFQSLSVGTGLADPGGTVKLTVSRA